MTDAQPERSQSGSSQPGAAQSGEPGAPSRSGGGGGPEGPPHRYTAQLANEIEAYWQGAWEREGAFRQPNPGEPGFDASRPKFYCLDMFPYPSGAGLHVGHPEGYTATDILCRYKRMRGFNVLHPMGWDAFGLPAEQYAIQTGVHPSITTRAAIDNFRRQLQRFGFSYDWSREFGTIDPDYYKWTQWIFLKIYDSWFDAEAQRARPIAELIGELESGDLRIGPDGELAHIGAPARALEGLGGEPGVLRQWHELSGSEQRAFIDDQRLAYIGEQVVNWCPKLGTALANEEVIDGRSERGAHPVLRKPLRQWMFRITAYAERLLKGLDEVDWPQSTRTQQAEWIGRSEGAEVDFGVEDTFLRVFTTRPDTIFGATYMVVAPEHPIIDDVLASPRRETPAQELRAYVERARNRSDVERQESKEKTGCFTGLHATNPATGEQIPVWCADYVLMGYGFGAIMAVPAHDERDFEFAQKFDLPIRDVVYTRQQAAIAFITRHATTDERSDNRWIATLADFMGITTSRDMGPDRFGEALNVLRERRLGRPVGATIDITPAKRPSPDEPGSIGERRGSTRMTWMQTVADLGMSTWSETAAQVEGKQLCARSGSSNSAVGYAANSTNDDVSLDGLPTSQAKDRIIEWMEQTGIGRRKVNYRLRDWLFSRQRYWGEPFPIVWDEQGNHHPVEESALPVVLPELADYAPIESEDPLPLLAKATDWVQTTAGEAGVTSLPPQTPVRRETNTMPGWAGSCWYFLRFCDPKNQERFVGEEAERYWMGGKQGGSALGKSALGRSALRADRSFHASSMLDHLPEDRIRAEGFVPRDPYPPGEYGPARDLVAYARRLPHFEMEGATYFVTWSTRGDRKLDSRERDEALSALLHFDDERCRVYAACVMPDHVHWIVRPFKGQKLGDLVASVKRYSAGQINKVSMSSGSVWQPDRFDHIVRDGAWLARFIRYVVENPVEAGLVERPSAYSWTALHTDVRVPGRDSTARIDDVAEVGSERRPTQGGVAEVGSERRPTQGGVDLYIGGAEHAVLHLLYARFWHMALYDLGYVSTPEPFRKLFHQGLITSYAYQDASGRLTPIDEVEQRGDTFVLKSTGEEVRQIVAKMSKALKNVVNPDDIIAEYGADTFRLYEMYMGPLEASKPWDTRAIAGLFRFLQRAWRLLVDEQTGEIKLANVHNAEIEKKLHRTIAKVGQDIENLAFNTAIAAMIELVNAATSAAATATGEPGPALTRDQAERFCLLLSPLAPHMAEEIAQKLGWDAMVTTTGAWPMYDEAQLRDDEVEIAVQLMGKVKARIMAPADIDADALRELALSHAEVAPLIEGKTVRKVVAVPGRLVNIVAN